MRIYILLALSREAGVQGSMAHKQKNKTKGRALTKEKDECCCCYRSCRFCHVRVRGCVRGCVRACVRVRACVCVRVCVCVYGNKRVKTPGTVTDVSQDIQ